MGSVSFRRVGGGHSLLESLLPHLEGFLPSLQAIGVGSECVFILQSMSILDVNSTLSVPKVTSRSLSDSFCGCSIVISSSLIS